VSCFSASLYFSYTIHFTTPLSTGIGISLTTPTLPPSP
jgi:hypothetical protein